MSAGQGTVPTDSLLHGSQMTVYLQSGKKQHDRWFWLQSESPAVVCWGKTRDVGKPNSAELVDVLNGPNIKDARALFDEVDADRSGQLDEKEVARLYKRANGQKLGKEKLKEAMREMDTDGGNGVNFEEFEKWWRKNGGELERHRSKALTLVLSDGRELLLVARTLKVQQYWLRACTSLLKQTTRDDKQHHPAMRDTMHTTTVEVAHMPFQGVTTDAALRVFELKPKLEPPAAGASELTTAVFTGSGSLGIALSSSDPLDNMWLEVDRDGNGVLGSEEVARMLEMMGRNSTPQYVDVVMLELDADHSGEINIAEFEAWYRRQPECSDEDVPSVVIEDIVVEAEATRGLTPGMRIVSVANEDMHGASLNKVSRAINAAGRPLTIVFASPQASTSQQDRVISIEDDPVDFLKARQENGSSGASPLRIGQLVDYDDLETGKIFTARITDIESDPQGGSPALYTIALPNGGGQLQTDRSRLMLPGNRGSTDPQSPEPEPEPQPEPQPQPQPEPANTKRVKARSVSEYMQQVQAKRQAQEDSAARTIQAAARGREVRRLPPVPDPSDEEDADVGLLQPSAKEQQSAKYIQANWKYRKHRNARRDAATKLQASWRGKQARLLQESLEDEMLAELLAEARIESSAKDQDEPEDQDHIEVVCPAGVDSGDFVNLAFDDGREIQVMIPAGIRPGMSFIADVSGSYRTSVVEDEQTVIPPFDIGSALMHAGQLQSTGKWNDAHVKYTEILENTAHLLDPGDLAELYNRRGLCCEKDGEVEQAFDDYSEGIQRGGARHSLLFHRGRLLAHLKRWSEAKRDLSSARDLQPSHGETLTLLKEAQEQIDQMEVDRKERMAKAEARRRNTAATMVQSSFRGHQARKQKERRGSPSPQQLMSELREGGDVAAHRLRSIIDHALDVLEPLLLQSPRGDSRKSKRSAVMSAEKLAYETLDGPWCDTLATCDVDTLETVVSHLHSLGSLKAGQNSLPDGFSILSEFVHAIEQCASTIQILFAADTALGMVFNCVPTESGLVSKLSVSKVDPGSQADVSTPRVRTGWNVISIDGQQVVQLEPDMALKALKPRPVTIVFSNADRELQEQQQPKQKQERTLLQDLAKNQSGKTARSLATPSTKSDLRSPAKHGSPPLRTSRTRRKADIMPTPHKQSSHLSRKAPPLPESTAIPSARKPALPETSARSPVRTSASRPAKTPIARKPNLKKLSSEARAKILASDEFKPLKQKLKALSYGTRGQDPRKLFAHYDRDSDGALEFSEFKNAVRKGGHVTPAACSDAQLRQLYAAVDEDGSGHVEIGELAYFIWGNRNLLEEHTDHDAADHAAPPPDEIAEVSHGSLAMPTDAARERAFDRMDVNHNGTLSLAEIDKAVVEVWPEFNHKKALMRAYKAADISRNGTITRDEFPLLLKYIVYFDNLWDKFDSIDKDGDHQLNMEEFHQGAEMLGLGKEHGLTWATTVQEFGLMDEDGGGAVRFDEFCAWCARKFVAAESSMKTDSSKPTKPQYDMMYYVALGEDGKELASEEVPVSYVQSLISTGHVTADTSVWAEGMDHGWLPLGDCASDFGLAEALGQRAPPPPPPVHEREPVEGGARAALMDMIPLFDQTKRFLNKVDSNDRSSPNLYVVDHVTTQPTVLRSRPRGESWAVPSSTAPPPLSPVRAKSKVDKSRSPNSTLSASSTSSEEDGVLLRRPRGKSWGAKRREQLQNRSQESEPEQEQQTSIIRRPRGKSWGAPRHEQGQKQEPKQEQQQEQQSSIIRRPRGASWGAVSREQEQKKQASNEMRLQTISAAGEGDSSADSDDEVADGQSTPDFASVADDDPSAASAEFDQRWRAMGGSDRVLVQIRQNLRGASYRKGGQDPRKLFEQYDRDNSGDIDRWEFRQAVRKGGRITPAMLGDADLDRLFDCVDVDGDGDLSIDELITMVWGDDATKKKQTRPEALPEFRSQAKRMTDDARFESIREYYLDERITSQRAAPSMKTIRSALEKNDFAVLCDKLQAKYGVHPLAIFNERHAVLTPTPSELKEQVRQSRHVGFGGRVPSPSRSSRQGKSLSPARTRRSTPPRRARMSTQRSRLTPERKADYSPVGQQQAKCSTVKQGTLQKLASGAVAEGGWLSLGSSQLPRSTSDARMDSKHDMESWYPQQVKIELTQTTFTHSPRGRNVTAAIHFCAAGQAMGQSTTGKIELESCSDIQYADGGADFTLVGTDGAQHVFAPVLSAAAEGLDEAARAEAVEECESWVAALRLAQHATDRALSCRLLFRFFRQVAGATRTKRELEQQVDTMGGEQFPALCDRLNQEYGAHPASLLI